MPGHAAIAPLKTRSLVWRKALVLAVALALPMMLISSPAKTATPAETFVQQSADRAFKILNDKSLTAADRRTQFRDFLLNLMDMRRIALFTLGRARATAQPADIDAFIDAFRQFAIANYETRIKDYDGQSLKVLSAVERSKGDFVVRTAMIDPSDPSANDPLEVDLRVLDENDKFVVVDASIAGVWLGIAQRDDIAGFLSQHRGNIPELVAHFREMTDALYQHAGVTKN